MGGVKNFNNFVKRQSVKLFRHVPLKGYNYLDASRQNIRVKYHHRFQKEDFRTLDKRNKENSGFLIRLIENRRMEASMYFCKWATKIGNRVLDLAMMGPEDEDALSELQDILFLRIYPERQFHVDMLYNELVPQLEYVEGDLIRTFPLRINEKSRVIGVIEFANNGFPALPVPPEAYKISRAKTYPELLMEENKHIARKLGENVDAVTDVSLEMLQLLPEARAVHSLREYQTKMDFEGPTLSWQQERIKKTIDEYQVRVQKQEERNGSVSRGEKTHFYRQVSPVGYRIPGKKSNTRLVWPYDYNNGYENFVDHRALEKPAKK